MHLKKNTLLQTVILHVARIIMVKATESSSQRLLTEETAFILPASSETHATVDKQRCTS